ncbi:MAG: glycoside hydrolase family 5 protein [Defluviitaleaceae bacterium]|nr:glycoside hydrolase family 5 protein [Defluviitaleaceae bacterium]
MGIIFDKYRSGVNLGGWISQCSYAEKHIAEFISESDVKKIASWGLDHIRLPVDYPVLESDDAPGKYLQSGFEVIDKTLAWCKAAGLNLVIDLHKAPGYAFYNAVADNVLFSDEGAQKRFVALWEEFARRYKGEGDNVVFELMNEIIDPHGETWNKIARRAIEAIHAVDPSRYILLGGPYYNSVRGLETLEIYDNPRVLYNFHFYEPMLVTHQRARWTTLKDTGINQPYPGKIVGIDRLNEIFPEKIPYSHVTEDTVFNIEYLEMCMKQALEFSQKNNKELYCGEYGVINNADLESRINYILDTNALFEKHRMGRALWTYKRMDFESIDENGEAVSPELVKILEVKK